MVKRRDSLLLLTGLMLTMLGTQAAKANIGQDDVPTFALSDDRGLWRAEVDEAAGFTLSDVMSGDPLVHLQLEGTVAPDVRQEDDLAIDASDPIGPRQLWLATERGVEHIIEVYEPSMPLLQRLRVEGLHPRLDHESVTLVDDDGMPRATYAGLHVFDALGVVHEAWFEVDDEGIDIHVETTPSTAWPVVIDPLAAVVVTIGSVCSSNGVACTIPNHFGRSMAVGQLVGDARPELVVGAPFHGQVGAPAEGGVVIFTPDANGVLQFFDFRGINGTQLTQAMCGTSLAIGDVVGTTNNDLIIGCPGAFGDPGAVVIYEGAPSGLQPSVLAPLTHTLGEIRAADVGGLALVDLGLSKLSVVATSSSRLLLWRTPTSVVEVVGTYNFTVEPSIANGQVNGLGNDDVVVGTSNSIVGFTVQGTTIAASATFTLSLPQGVLGNRVALGDFSGAFLENGLVVGQPDFNNGQGRVLVYSGSDSGWIASGPIVSFYGSAQGTRLGQSVAAFDINGDGFDDVVGCEIGASAVSARCRVWGGSPTIGVTQVERPSTLFASNVGHGESVPVAGDFVGDGGLDVVNGQHLSSGAVGAVTRNDGTKAELNVNSFKRLNGMQASGALGQGALVVADINQDGADDIVVNEAGYNSGVGAIHVFLGGPAMDLTPDWTLVGVNTRASLGANGIAVGRFRGPLNPPSIALTSSAGVLIYHAQPNGLPATTNIFLPDQIIAEQGVTSMVAGGNMIGDLGEALILGIPNKDGPGRVDIYSSNGAGLIVTAPVQTFGEPIAGCAESSLFGFDVAIAGDVDKNGRVDLLVSAPECAGGGTKRGKAVLFPAQSGQAVSVAATWQFNGDLDNAHLSVVAGIGDVNDNQKFDFAVGAPDRNGRAGRIWIFEGGSGQLPSTTPVKIHTGGSFNGTGSGFGSSIAGGVDMNLDGYSDIIVGAPTYANSTAALRTGRIYIYFGGPLGIQAWTTTSTGSNTDDGVGLHVAVGHLDSSPTGPDGRYGDVAFSIPGAEDTSQVNEGVVRIRAGRW